MLTVEHPPVESYLFAIKSGLAQPPADELPVAIRVLAALATFYRPEHQAHWIFWNKETRVQMARLVDDALGEPFFFLSFFNKIL